ncbi:MAG: hypothetical protein M3072_11945, partial [Candidatus Dormibacteraeota bacterium]|nr:hypothetical protein [Candidatus Dormibacteraeota bacterium]
MTVEDVRLFQYRLRLFARAREVGATQACRELGYHRSWYYRWKPLVERHGLEILRARERGAAPGAQSGTTLAGGASDRLPPWSAIT